MFYDDSLALFRELGDEQGSLGMLNDQAHLAQMQIDRDCDTTPSSE
jgi:hypothetical protein